ncbi:hypothetical protein F4808DRAFT_441 [Astrocystis sublimbata]|nr:hypothetical protein F4808DRAFT_441 [Astrocystis sublimbata]
MTASLIPRGRPYGFVSISYIVCGPPRTGLAHEMSPMMFRHGPTLRPPWDKATNITLRNVKTVSMVYSLLIFIVVELLLSIQATDQRDRSLSSPVLQATEVGVKKGGVVSSPAKVVRTTASHVSRGDNNSPCNGTQSPSSLLSPWSNTRQLPMSPDDDVKTIERAMSGVGYRMLLKTWTVNSEAGSGGNRGCYVLHRYHGCG